MRLAASAHAVPSPPPPPPMLLLPAAAYRCAAAAAATAAAPAGPWLRPGFLLAAAQQPMRRGGPAYATAGAAPDAFGPADAPGEGTPAPAPPPPRRRGRPRKTTTAAQEPSLPSASAAAAAAVASGGASRPLSTSSAHHQHSHVTLAGGPGDAVFRDVTGWVTFSDLHVSHRTIDTCMEVLARVREEAKARDAGVLFLGDFWDRRGDLPVGPLNSVIRELKAWDRPVMMLPGNHDQVDLAGRTHSLTPLAAACKWAHVFTEPALYEGALWLPYRRDEGQVRAALKAAGARVTRAVFAHADLLTAHMNAAHQAASGLPADVFPRDIPVYMGHYHLPQTVPGTRITYIGSPYQVSRSEAGQSKRLLVLSPDWVLSEEIPLDIGPRHYTFTSPGGVTASPTNSEDDAAAAAAAAAGDPAALAAAAAAAGPAGASAPPAAVRALLSAGALRRGDRVRLSVTADADGQTSVTAGQTSGEELAELQAAAAAAGVLLQVVVAPSTARAARIESAEQLSMRQLLAAYAAATGMDSAVHEAAEGILMDLGETSAAAPPATHIEFEGMEVEGFGPFQGCVSYPLSSRGLVAVTGRNEDDDSAESNGAGKTSLVTALLWAMKAGDRLTQAQVVNENSRMARVKVWGRLNGESFVVERSTRLARSGKAAASRLGLQINGTDVTQQAIDLTERLLVERFASPLLARAVLFGQEELMAMLHARDREFKELLGAVVDTSCWDGAKAAAAAKLKRLTAEAAIKEGEARHLASLVTQTEAELAGAAAEEEAWEVDRLRRQAAAERAAEEARGRLRSQLLSGYSLRSHLISWLEGSKALAAQLTAARDAAAAHLSEARAALAASEAAAAEGVRLLSEARAAKEEQDRALSQRQRERAAAEAARQREETAQHAQHEQQHGPLPQFDEAAAAARAAAAAAAVDEARRAHDGARRRAVELGTHAAAARQRAEGYGRLLGTDGGSGPAAMAAAVAVAPQQQQVQQQVGRPGQLPPPPLRVPSGGSRVPSPPPGIRRRPRAPPTAAPGGPPGFRVMAASAAADPSPAAGTPPHSESCSSGNGAGGVDGSGGGGGPVCDRCLQPIDVSAFRARLEEMWSEARASEAAAAEAEAAATAALAALSAAEEAARHEQASSDAARRAVAADRERAMRERAAAAQAAAQADAERRLAEQRTAAAADQQLASEAANAVARAAEAAAARQAALAAAHDAASTATTALDTAERRLSALPSAQDAVQAAADMPLQFAAEVEHQHSWVGLGADLSREWQQQQQSQGGLGLSAVPGSSSGSSSSSSGSSSSGSSSGGAEDPKPLTDRLYQEWVPAARAASRALSAALADSGQVPAANLNPLTRKREGLAAALATRREQRDAAAAARLELAARAAVLRDVDAAFGRSGIPSFVLEGLLGELQSKTSEHLQQLATGMALELRATRELGGSSGSGSARGGRSGSSRSMRSATASVTGTNGGENSEESEGEVTSGGPVFGLPATREEIMKVVKVRAANGEMRERSVAQLSGGEKKRAALALGLAFTQVAAARGRLTTNLIVLDEVLEKLDGEGCSRVASLLASLPHASKLVVGQAHSFVTDTFGAVDIVVKRGGAATVVLAPGAEPPTPPEAAGGVLSAAAAAGGGGGGGGEAEAPAAGRKTPGRRGRRPRSAAKSTEAVGDS